MHLSFPPLLKDVRQVRVLLQGIEFPSDHLPSSQRSIRFSDRVIRVYANLMVIEWDLTVTQWDSIGFYGILW